MKRTAAILLLLNAALLLSGLLFLPPPEAPAPIHSGGQTPATQFNSLQLRSPQPVVNSEAVPEAGLSEQCQFIGPMEARDLPGAIASISGSGGSERWVETIRVEGSLWWVHLPPASTTTEAQQTLNALQARGIDSFRIDDGAFNNAISLGYFRSQDNAARLTEEYQRRDISAELMEIPQERSLYWYRLPEGLDMASLAAVLDTEGMTSEARACDWNGSTE